MCEIQKRNNAWKTQGSIMQDLLQDNEKRCCEKSNKQICCEVLDGILDKMFVQEESTTEIKHDDGEHDAANCQPSKKRKFNEIDDEALEKMLEEQTVEYDRKIAFKIALGKEVDEILGRGKVKQVAI